MFISHPDFCNLEPVDVYHVELDEEGNDVYRRDDPTDPITAAHPNELRNKHIIYRRRGELPSFERAVLQRSTRLPKQQG